MIARAQPAGMGGLWELWQEYVFLPLPTSGTGANDVSYSDPAELTINTPGQVAARIAAAEARNGTLFTDEEKADIHAKQDISAEDLARINKTIADGEKRGRNRAMLVTAAVAAGATVVGIIALRALLK